MTDSLFDNSAPETFEVRIAKLVPQLSPAEHQQLLYQCAFSAGQTEGRKSLRRWQAVAAALVVTALGLSIPLVHEQVWLAKQRVEPTRPTDIVPRSTLAQAEIPTTARQAGAVELDAWQLQSAEASLTHELACFEQTDPHLRSLAVGTLTRTILEP